MSPACEEVSILSVEAWSNGSGCWDWNMWHKVGQCRVDVCKLSTRKLLRFLREAGVLGPGSVGRVAVDDDGYNMVVVERHTRSPLYAIAYGEVDA